LLLLVIRENASDFIDHHLPKDSPSAHGASHHALVPGPPPSKCGAAGRCQITQSLLKMSSEIANTGNTSSILIQVTP